MSDKELTLKQKRYVEEYVLDPSSQKNAAIRAGYSLETATQSAYALMRLSHIRDAIKDLQGQARERLGITQDRILQELALIALAPISNKVDEHGISIVEVHQPAEITVSTINGKEKIRSVTVKSVKLADKISALEKLGKHLGMFKEQVEVSASQNLESLIKDSFLPKAEDKSDAQITAEAQEDTL